MKAKTTPPPPPPDIFTMEDLEEAYVWLFKLRKDYSPHSDIWTLRREWNTLKHSFLEQLNDGSYQFSPLERYEIGDSFLSLWSSQDMMALKLISLALGRHMADHIPSSCYHVKDHGGLKKAVAQTYKALPQYQFVLRSDIKGYYESIHFDALLSIIESYDPDLALLSLVRSACLRTETRGGLFYEYHEKGIPKGSPLSPLLGAIALIPLDLAMQSFKQVYYARFMDDWVVLTKSKTALRKVIKVTHRVMETINLQLHPLKTYIGKISHGFNFLAYYMDPHKILPSQETVRRFHERATALYERPLGSKNTRRYRGSPHRRDISLYPVYEAPPTNEQLQYSLSALLARGSTRPDLFRRMQRYIGQWSRWLKLGLLMLDKFAHSVQTYLPCLFSCWTQGTTSTAATSAAS